MTRTIIIFSLAFTVASLAFAQAPPPTKPLVAPTAEKNHPDTCPRTTLGLGGDVDDKGPQANGAQDKNLSDRLARSNGVICPPPLVDPDIKQPAPPGGNMPVIPPPGGDLQFHPK